MKVWNLLIFSNNTLDRSKKNSVIFLFMTRIFHNKKLVKHLKVNIEGQYKY